MHDQAYRSGPGPTSRLFIYVIYITTSSRASPSFLTYSSLSTSTHTLGTFETTCIIVPMFCVKKFLTFPKAFFSLFPKLVRLSNCNPLGSSVWAVPATSILPTEALGKRYLVIPWSFETELWMWKKARIYLTPKKRCHNYYRGLTTV